MKTIRILLLALLASAAFVCPRAQAQIGQITNPVSAPLYAQDAGTCSATANSNLIQQLPPNASTTTVNLSGTFSATVTVRASNNGGATWVTLGTASAAGTTTYGTNSYTHLCADVTTYTSGTVNVTISTGVIGGGNGNSGSLSLPTTLSAPGVFTNTQMNENWSVVVGSGCTPSSIFALWSGGSNFLTDGASGTVCVPAAASNDWSQGVAGYALNSATGTCVTGQCEAVAVGGLAVSNATAAAVWGANFLTTTTSGHAAEMFGVEIDTAPHNTGDTGFGMYVHSGGSAQPSGTYDGIALDTNGSSGFNVGLVMNTGSIANGQTGILLNQYVSGNGSNSPVITMNTTGSGGTTGSFQMQAAGNGIATPCWRFFGIIGGTNFNNCLSFSGATGFGLGTIGFSGPISLPTFTVSTLPSASTAGAGAMVRVSDASTFTVGTCTGGGSDFMIAISNGTTWSCH